ncbi:MAG: hypothetical protein ABSG53_08085 [Thermoguttaceae bacterium]
MRHFVLPMLLNLPFLLVPVVLLGADAKPKAAANDQPMGGAKLQQPPADPAAAGPKADVDADNADSDKPKRLKTGARPTSMAITAESGGLKTLTIHFRWSLYPNASIEVRLVPGPDPKGSTVAPIYFSEKLKGAVRDALYTCLDHPDNGGRTHSFTKDKLVYKMTGRRNSLGNQGVHVQVRREEGDTPEANPAAAYLQLDTWAVDKETLSLDLARDEFAKSGTLFVWFFRGDQVVWEEQIRWPGYK